MAERSSDYEIRWLEIIPFLAVHAVAIAGIAYYGWSWSGFALALSIYFALMMFGVTAGYHRYFSHRAFKTNRGFQFVLALLATCTAQKGVLWWAAHHRHHHKHSDQPDDVHSPLQRGFWWSHVGWILVRRHQEIRWEKIPDLAKYPELRWLQKHELKVVVAFAATIFALGAAFGAGGWALLWGFFAMLPMLWHGTFTINSFTHIWGRKRYASGDESRNSLLFALITCGEGWHNNHHYYQRSTSQGFYWWEIDLTYYALKVLSWTGLVWDVKRPPRHVRDARPQQVEAAVATAALDDDARVDRHQPGRRNDQRVDVELPDLGVAVDQVGHA